MICTENMIRHRTTKLSLYVQRLKNVGHVDGPQRSNEPVPGEDEGDDEYKEADAMQKLKKLGTVILLQREIACI